MPTPTPLRVYTCSGFTVEIHKSLSSTNTYLKTCAAQGADMLAAIALTQTEGRGRLGRSFYSPGTGLYMSALIRGVRTSLAHLLTPAAAVAVAQSLESCGSPPAGIKWVNDVYIGEKKVCGILTETSASGDLLDHAIIGIGVNITPPPGGFPADIRDRAGAVFESAPDEMRFRLAEEILKRLSNISVRVSSRDFLGEYRSRSVALGRNVTVYPSPGAPPIEARAVEIDDDCRLLCETPDGRSAIFTGEVSVRGSK